MPHCRVCHEDKPIYDFTKNKSYRDGYATICKTCAAIKAKQYRNANILGYKARKFGVSEEFLTKLFESTDVCQICGEQDRRALSIDHNHSTGKIRGLLCDACNKALGCFKDDLFILERAKRYLMQSKGIHE